MIVTLPLELLLHHELDLGDGYGGLARFHLLDVLGAELIQERGAELQGRLGLGSGHLLELAKENVVHRTEELDDVLLLTRRLVLLNHDARRAHHALGQQSVFRDQVHLLLELLASLAVEQLDDDGVILGGDSVGIGLTRLLAFRGSRHEGNARASAAASRDDGCGVPGGS